MKIFRLMSLPVTAAIIGLTLAVSSPAAESPSPTTANDLASRLSALRQDGTWSRKDDLSPFVFRNAGGEQILLSPGQPWIHVVPMDMKVASQ